MENEIISYSSCILMVLLLFLLYIYYKGRYDHWEQQNIPYLKSRIFFGSINIFNFIKSDKPLHELEQDSYNTFGRLYGRYDGETAVLSVAEPKLLKRVLVKDFQLFMNRRDIKFNDPVMDNTLFALVGEDWKRVRSTVSPTLTQAKLKRMLPLLEECADNLIENIANIMKDKKSVECQTVFGSFTIDTIARCAFGMKINSLNTKNDPFVDNAKRLLDCCLGWRTLMTMLLPPVMKFFRLSLLNPKTTDFYRKTIVEVVNERKKVRDREDFLQLLLDAQNGSHQDPNNNNVKPPKKSESNITVSEDPKNNSKSLSHDEMIAQCVTFFIAGYDATTSLLSYAIYNLAIHQEHQRKCLQEIEDALAKHDGILNYETLAELKFMEAVLSECLRLCPPMVRSERSVEKDCLLTIDDCDTKIHLKKGMLISIPVYAIHRDPEWYPEPHLFKPERFYEPDPKRPQYVHLPFGAGPRMCIGNRFVLMQVKFCLTKVLLRFHAQPTSKTPSNLELKEVRNTMKVSEVEIALNERK